jgi:hypothetical protein
MYDASAGNGALTMTCIQESAQLFIVLGLWAEDGIDFVVQDRRAPILRSDLAEEVGRRDIASIAKVKIVLIRLWSRLASVPLPAATTRSTSSITSARLIPA